MKIAVPTDDRVKITSRSGRTKGFLVFTIDNSKISTSEYRINPHKHHDEEEEKHDHSHKEMVEVLSDCEVMVTNRVGPHLKKDLDEAGIPVYLASAKNVKEAVEEYLAQL